MALEKIAEFFQAQQIAHPQFQFGSVDRFRQELFRPGIETRQPGVILLDIMMPGMDGWETLERLKADRQCSTIPVIVFTAREHREGPGKAAELGAVEYFRKPFRPDTLVQTIRRHLDAASAVAG